jgi:choline-glycine betaine transporter
VPLVASSALVWGAGTLLAFAASVHAFRRDKERGIRALVVARARSDGEYLAARVLGLARVVATVTALGTLAVGLTATLVARGSSVALHVLASTVAAVTFSVAFATIIAPVGFATLAARSRVGGYLALTVVLVVPELLEGPMSRVLPEGWGELVSIPGALAALRSSLLQGSFDPLRLMRATALIGLVVLVALLIVRGQLARFDREEPA